MLPLRPTSPAARRAHRSLPQRRRLSAAPRLRSAAAQPPQVVFSGIQPTGVPHLGNYLGALRQWVRLQDHAAPAATLLFSIVDLHAITVRQDPRALQQCRREMLASLLAVGLDPARCIVFAQSSVKQHAELMWILSCAASMGYLGRMTQWKSKMNLPDTASPLAAYKDQLKLGLFSYPVLQAADILLYNTTHVPVGEDQAQHLEFTRELAIGFNHLYGPLLTVPETQLSPAKRVMSLVDPSKKMSKSDPRPKSRILITDSRDTIHSKLKSALTDSIDGVSYDRHARPGVSNLVDLIYHFDQAGAASPEELAQDMKDLTMRALKEKAADTVDRTISPIRERYGELMSGDQRELVEHAQNGARKAEVIAESTMQRVRSAMGMAW
ncbi:tryptophanyl-tRNA synthetase [Stagonosporopsis vannaccii]|nr:tryptophanyl-tRNA synthetase [Stagonosporopsis vannaccii]